MAHGVCEVLGESNSVVKMIGKPPQRQQSKHHPNSRKNVGAMGCRRIFSPFFKIRVLESYRNDVDCKGNQRATARKYNLHRRQIQKWLQAEDALRKTCIESNSMNNNGSVINRNAVNVSMPLSPPLSSPSSSSPSPSAVMMHHDNHHHHHHHNHQQNSGAPATSPSLNLGLARLHGDELAIQQQQQSHTQQHQAPPPPPPPPPSHSAQVAAAQALAVAATTQASYRFHAAAAAATALQPVAATGYPHFKDKLPIHQQQQSHHYAPATATAEHSMFYQPLAAATYQHTPAPSHHRYTIHYNYQQNPPSAPSHPAESDFHYQRQQPRLATTLLTTEVKTERASPDSAATPGPYESAPTACSADLERQQPRIHYLKREHCAEEREHVDYQRRTSSISSTVTSGSPSPSHPDHLECMPPSPRDSAEESAGSSPEMGYEKRSGAVYIARKRKAYSLKFKINVLDAYYKDDEIVRNQRATARKFKIDRRQVQKWLDQECKLRGVICDSNNRQRLGPIHESNSSSSCSEETTTTIIPVDLRTPTTTDLGQISPQSSSSFYNYRESSPSSMYVDSSLTPPYSTPGCSFSGCCSQETRIANPQSYCCYSPGEMDSGISLKQSTNCTDSCFNHDSSKVCLEDAPSSGSEDERPPVQDMPLCLVKPKKPSTPVAPASNKDAILFKPYLDNPVSKPVKDESATSSPGNNNNNCQDTRDLNERNNGFQQPWNGQPQQYFEGPHVRSAFVRYPSAVHYS